MFNIFRSNPRAKLEKKRASLLEEAMHIQRSGDLKKYSLKIEAIDKLEKEIESLPSTAK